MAGTVLLAGLFGLAASQLVSNAGDAAVIPGWSLQSSAKLNGDLTSFATAGANTSGWYEVAYRGSVFAGLVENGIYNETELFFSNNLESVAIADGTWLYRREFQINPAEGQHYFLSTHGITSRAGELTSDRFGNRSGKTEPFD